MEVHQLHKIFLKHFSICTDTRKISVGCLFFALKGENYNGNKFAEEALDKGASYSIADDKSLAGNDRIIIVEDVLTSLQELANFHRMTFDIPVIGLTGSNGKTTSKELIHAVLGSKYNCLATIGNLNNHIGVPLTLLNLRSDHEIAIIEMGANHVGEIEFLSNIAQPNYGMITNIGKAHIGEFGGFDKIIQAKSELYNHIAGKNETLFVNGDDPLLMSLAKVEKKVSYGSELNFNTSGEVLSQDPFLNVVLIKDGIEIRTKLVGRYNLSNVLAAVCIGEHFNVHTNEIKAALENYSPDNNRSQILKTESNTLIMDAYNANPSSVIVAIENLLSMDDENKFFILGDMLELGGESAKEHTQILQILMDNNLKGVLIGPEFAAIYQENEVIISYNSTSQAIENLPSLNLKNHLILLKGSRGMKLETLRPIL